ncbi:alpha/beta hydrolase [Amycolatopsis cynarae]|uniref:Alpha/beta hydrolase n=1 Tax=Amycolatopsis cynarae TaxID=2995223 RepID=A0ABY7B942_9PSEU|nr:alpha/beta hydrolase [Amycolatopsis sp. HUAS 11-8]WAL68459.1 alpha/beta hydrolase [Amycolatopsis sp. HUAS 11-8]
MTEKVSIYRTEAGARAVREYYLAALAGWPVEHEELRIPTPEGETFVLAAGDAAAPPLVLLHGSGSNSMVWMGRIPELAREFRVYAVDMIGEPGLSAASRPPLDSGRYAAWLDAVLDFLGVERAGFMGISLGGWLALDYTIRRPERVARLALSCPGGIGRQKLSVVFRALLLSALGEWGRRRSASGTLGPALSTMDCEVAEQAMEWVMLVSRHYRYRRDPLPVFGDDALRKLAVPVQVIVGQQDVLFDSAETKRRLETAVPHAIVRLLPGVGHFVPAQPDELEFLTSQPK